MRVRPKSEAQKARDRANEKVRRVKRMEDPAYAEKIRAQKRAYKARLRLDPAVRARWAKWLKEDRIKNPDRYMGYQVRYYEKRGDTPSERRKRWRAENHDRYVAGYKETNPRRPESVIARFRRGDASFDELSECLRERYVRNLGRLKGEG